MVKVNYMLHGWIKLHRSISDHWVWDCEFSYAQAWIDLLISANHATKKTTIKGQLITIERGQQARSEVTLAKSWKWSRNKVRRFLKNLENDGMINQKTTHLTSIITICNYDDFQSGDTADGTAKEQQTEHVEDSRRNTNKNVKNVKNEKNIKDLFDSSRIIPVWNSLGCKQHRMLTEKAAKALGKTYKAYCKASENPRELNEWLEVYLKNGFARYMTDHHREMNDGKWAADLEFAVRFDTYEKVKNNGN